jgi:hypothetical protein
VADLAWTLLTVLLVILSLVVMAVGFPGKIGRRVKTRILRRAVTGPEDRATPRRDVRDA